MKTVAYTSPYVPPEWVTAFGLTPRWLPPRTGFAGAAAIAGRGVCPYAATVIERAAAGLDADALVLTTACDQMRYAAAWVGHDRRLPRFLLNVPTWWHPSVVGLYRGELDRLGRFLASLGGSPPDTSTLAQVMLRYDAARAAVRQARDRLSARALARALIRCRQGEDPDIRAGARAGSTAGTVRMAVLGGPLGGPDDPFYDAVDRAGGRIVLDGTEMGERTLPPPWDPARVRRRPLGTLAETYTRLPDAFRRPNHALYRWLEEHLAARQVQGILLWRYVGCDLWHAERDRLRRASLVPVLEIDAWQDGAEKDRTRGRIEAFVETLAAAKAGRTARC